jgi:hypothetical protein
MTIKTITWIYQLVIMVSLFILTSSCLKMNNLTDTASTDQYPELSTSDVNSITKTTATCGGYITYDGGFTVIARGVCWSTGQTPTISDNKTTDGTGAGGFPSTIAGLSSNTTYYVRAYATNSAGTGYGSALSFKTQ